MDRNRSICRDCGRGTFRVEGICLPCERRAVSHMEFLSALEIHHQRWTQANPITGLPYALVRSVEQHQGSRRVGPPRRVSFLRRLLKRLTCSR
jgi:hypothetical protein